MRQTADLLSALHEIDAGQLGLPAEPQANSQYLRDFEALWDRSALRAFLDGEWRQGRRMLDGLPEAFAHRRSNQLLMLDSQPKNIVLSDSNAPRFVDIDYVGGNPAIALGHFLISLDRLALRWPGARSSQVDDWKRAFLIRYLRQAPPSVAEDLVFFYPWLVVRVSAWHCRTRPWLAPCLRRCYGQRLGRFCRRLHQFSGRYDAVSVPTLCSA